jgi:uncharacterized membrane protein (UPF0182 family)
VPALSKVIVAYGSSADQIAIGDSFSQALSKLFGQSFDDIFGGQTPTPGGSTPPPTTGGPASNPRVAELVRTIQGKQADAQAALRAVDLKTYATIQDEIKLLIDQLATLVVN